VAHENLVMPQCIKRMVIREAGNAAIVNALHDILTMPILAAGKVLPMKIKS